jgi:hypothetical protein
VILYEQIDSRGQFDTVEVVRGQESLAAATVAAAHQWRFAPGRRGGVDSASEVVGVVTFRGSATPAKCRYLTRFTNPRASNPRQAWRY